MKEENSAKIVSPQGNYFQIVLIIHKGEKI